MNTPKLTPDQYAEALGGLPIKTWSTMDRADANACARTVLSDLEQLATRDGCVAAGVALEMLMLLAEWEHAASDEFNASLEEQEGNQ